MNETFRKGNGFFPSSSEGDGGGDLTWYWSTARKLLQYTRMYLTTEAMAACVLKTMGVAETARHVLVFTRNHWDNLHQSVVTGLDGLGIKMTVIVERDRGNYNCFEHRYKGIGDGTNFTRSREGYLSIGQPSSADIGVIRPPSGRCCVHGTGSPWANRIRGREHRYIPQFNTEVQAEVNRGEFDAVIDTFFDDGDAPPFYRKIKDGVRNRVAVLDHHDTNPDDPKRETLVSAKKVYFFSRELRRANC